MNRSTLLLLPLFAVTVLAACSDDAATSPKTAGGGGSAGSSGEGGGAGAPPAAEPITAPKEQWTWIPFDDAFCANGTTTGIGVNLTDKSDRALIFVMGGGACWSEATCYTLRTALNFETGYTEQNMMDDLAQVESSGGFLDRSAADNPFKDYSIVFVPYCTGDLHVGDNVVKYGDKTAMHVGARNMEAYLRRLVPTFASSERVYLAGISAGGFGALFNWWRAQEAFGEVRVDLIDDSGIPTPPTPGVDGFADEQYTQWNAASSLPPDCPECRDDTASLVGYYGKKFPDHHGAFMSFTRDTVISQFNGITQEQFQTALEEEIRSQLDPNPNLRYFVFEGANHVLFFDPSLTTNGVTLLQWLTQMVTDDPAWSNQHP